MYKENRDIDIKGTPVRDNDRNIRIVEWITKYVTLVVIYNHTIVLFFYFRPSLLSPLFFTSPLSHLPSFSFSPSFFSSFSPSLSLPPYLFLFLPSLFFLLFSFLLSLSFLLIYFPFPSFRSPLLLNQYP